MKTIILIILAFVVLAVVSTSCEKKSSNPYEDSKDQIKIELRDYNNFNLKSEGEDDEQVFPDTIH